MEGATKGETNEEKPKSEWRKKEGVIKRKKNRKK